jgi:uncharacterized protein (DUF4415 family)
MPKQKAGRPVKTKLRPQPYGVPDEENPEWTEEDFARARPFAEVFPELAEAARALKARGRPKAEKKLEQFSLRIEPEVLQTFKEEGPGWQQHMRATLAKEAKRLTGNRPKRRPKKRA